MMVSIWLIDGLIMPHDIIDEYVGKIYMESKRHPRYHIETTL